MPSIRRAVIDVGTNSVKVLVADVAGQSIQPVWEDSKQTRLGSGFYDTHQLQAEPVARTARAVARFAAMARELQAADVRVIGTSAARDAINAQELLASIESSSGLRMEIISGDQEAEWTFQGVTTDLRFGNESLLIMDVGGGSSEFILGQEQHKQFRESFPIGTVRLLEKIPHSDPPLPGELAACRAWVRETLKRAVEPRLGPALAAHARSLVNGARTQLVGTGGTTSILARIEACLEAFDRDRIEAIRLSRERLREHAERLWSVSLAERQKIVGLPAKRADVILTGVVIFEGVMEQFGFSELRVSTRGLRFAAVMGAE
jgi:exopolyphosphatase/guanosine-5'-triphosphate,3'-diphosphate pyrophosphatase